MDFISNLLEFRQHTMKITGIRKINLGDIRPDSYQISSITHLSFFKVSKEETIKRNYWVPQNHSVSKLVLWYPGWCYILDVSKSAGMGKELELLDLEKDSIDRRIKYSKEPKSNLCEKFKGIELLSIHSFERIIKLKADENGSFFNFVLKQNCLLYT